MDLKSELFRRGFKELDYGELTGVCPKCGKDDHFNINYLKLKGHCYKCNYSLNSKNIYSELGITDVEGFDYRPIPKFHDTPVYVLPTIRPLRKKSWMGNKAVEYIKNRGFTLEFAELLGWGYGVDDYEGRLIIPFLENSSEVFFQARAYLPAFLKVKNPAKLSTGFNGSIGKSHFVYNIDNARKYREMVVCEGWADAASVGLNAVSLQGKTVSKIQKLKIIACEPDELTILLDSKATDSAYELANEFFGSVPVVRVAHLPNAEDGTEHDPNSSDPGNLQRALKNAEVFDFRKKVLTQLLGERKTAISHRKR